MGSQKDCCALESGNLAARKTQLNFCPLHLQIVANRDVIVDTPFMVDARAAGCGKCAVVEVCLH